MHVWDFDVAWDPHGTTWDMHGTAWDRQSHGLICVKVLFRGLSAWDLMGLPNPIQSHAIPCARLGILHGTVLHFRCGCVVVLLYVQGADNIVR